MRSAGARSIPGERRRWARTRHLEALVSFSAASSRAPFSTGVLYSMINPPLMEDAGPSHAAGAVRARVPARTGGFFWLGVRSRIQPPVPSPGVVEGRWWSERCPAHHAALLSG